MPSCELYHIKTPEFDINEGLRIALWTADAQFCAIAAALMYEIIPPIP
jgi:hypothetical protein